MKSTINYYYNLNPNKINQIFHYYYFYINYELYYFKIYSRKESDIQAIYQLNRDLLNNNIMVNKIIDNRNHSIITYVNQIPYILTKVSVNINKPIRLSEISFLSNLKITYKEELMRNNWINLWMDKIDYLEYFHEQNFYQHPILSDSFYYYIGLSENAICYLNYTLSNMKPELVDIGVLAHDTIFIDDTIDVLYEPQNIIIDHKSRDLAEYIKNSFFKDNFDIFDELDEYFKYNYFSIYGIHLLMARILYPSFYFEMYDSIVKHQENESAILKITSRINDYEKYLRDVWKYFHKYYDIKDIAWLNTNTD